MKKISFLCFAITFAFAASPLAAQTFPITVTSCDRQVEISTPPKRALVHGSNLIEMMLALGLEDQMIGYSGRIEMEETLPIFPAAADLRHISRTAPTLETFLEANADFYFAGWSYGLRVGGEVSPERLSRYGIPLYELSESCVRLGQQTLPSFNYLFRDLHNLAAIFGVSERANTLIAKYQLRLAIAAKQVPLNTPRPRIFVYDSGEKVPFTAGGFAMPQAIIEASGGTNIAADIENSWVRMDWETVAARDPQVIIIVDYGEVSAEDKIQYMKQHPAFSHIAAVRNDRFLVLSYDELTPGPRNVNAVERLTEYLHNG